MTSKITPYWQSECGRATVFIGDCHEIMSNMTRGLFHAAVTDPPYGLEFMGKEWDAPWATSKREDEMDDPVKSKYLRHNVEYVYNSIAYQEWFKARAEEMIYVMKPGAHILSFGGSRMWHRMSCAIEDAGFEIRDTLMWLYGSGFPKSYNISKGIDKMLGVERKVVEDKVSGSGLAQGQFNRRNSEEKGGYGFKEEYDVTEPGSEEARQWNGWGTTLKPAFEPIILARSPMHDSTAKNTLEHGCGGMNIDACRVGSTGTIVKKVIESKISSGSGVYNFNTKKEGDVSMRGYATNGVDGKWPTNVIHDGSEEVVTSLPEGADRFFYSAKANEDDRPHGKIKDAHPTVKPMELMSYLVRLVCVQGGMILDPFMGTGSTGCAAIKEGMWFVGIDQSQKYADMAIGRLKLELEKRPASSASRFKVTTRKTNTDTAPSPKRLRS